jgi:hypothetical protein
VDAFRKGDRSPREEVEATLVAIENSDLNAFSFINPDLALAAAETADTIMLWWSMHAMLMHAFLTEEEAETPIDLLSVLLPDAELLMSPVAGHA